MEKLSQIGFLAVIVLSALLSFWSRSYLHPGMLMGNGYLTERFLQKSTGNGMLPLHFTNSTWLL